MLGVLVYQSQCKRSPLKHVVTDDDLDEVGNQPLDTFSQPPELDSVHYEADLMYRASWHETCLRNITPQPMSRQDALHLPASRDPKPVSACDASTQTPAVCMEGNGSFIFQLDLYWLVVLRSGV